MSREMWDALKSHIVRERERKKQGKLFNYNCLWCSVPTATSDNFGKLCQFLFFRDLPRKIINELSLNMLSCFELSG